MGPFFKDYLRVPETDILFNKISVEILVDTYPDTFGTRDDTKDCRFPVTDMHGICEHIKDRKIVLHDHHRVLCCQFPDKFCGSDPLVDIKERGYFIKKIEIGIPGKAGSNCHSLQFSRRLTWKCRDRGSYQV